MWKVYAMGLLVGLGLLWGGSRARQQSRDAQAERYSTEKADATPIGDGVLTPAQRVHGGLFAARGYPERVASLMGNITIAQLAKSQSKEDVLGIDMHVGVGPLMEPDTPEHFFGGLARGSDAVVRGRVIKKSSQTTVDGYFLFTDYEIRVDEVFRDNPLAPIGLGTTITVTRPGGKIIMNGVVIKVVDHHFDPLPVNGNEVVLFLKFVPETASYQAAGDSHSFELLDSSVRALNEDDVPAGVLERPEALLKAIRATANP